MLRRNIGVIDKQKELNKKFITADIETYGFAERSA